MPSNYKPNRALKSISFGFAVVMMHPKEFTSIKNGKFTDEVNWNQINELKLLIQKIKDNNLKIVPIGKINLDSDVPSIPKWIKNNAGWWAEDSISDDEFINNIQYLIKTNIIKLNN